MTSSDSDSVAVFPSTAYLGLSYLCNMRCAHCYALDEPRSAHLTLAEVTTLLDDLSDMFCCSLVFGHGEPFLYKDFFEVLRHAKRRGMNTIIMTNGSRIDRDVARRLRQDDVEPYRLYLSIDHCEPERHDAQRRVRGAYDMAVRAIHILREEGLDARISSTINVADPRPAQMWIDLCDAIGVPGMSLLTIRDKHDYTAEQMRRYADVLRDLVRATVERPDLDILLHDPLVFRFVDTHRLPEHVREKLVRENKCTAGTERIAIQPDGTVKTCNLVDGPVLGNIREQSIKEIWDRSEYLKRIQARHHADALRGCGSCSGYEVCRGGCPAFSHASEHDLVRDARCDALEGTSLPLKRLPVVTAQMA